MTRIQSFFIRFSRSFNLSAGPLLAVTLACLPGLSHGATFGPQSSTKAAEWGFDFVEEFDGLQDWDQSGCREGGRRCGNRYDLEDPQDMPKLRDGSPSAWGYFSMWNDNTPAPVPWIGSETASGRKVWRGTKSATIDIGTTNYGPSRLGLHFGADGYRDFSLFYMAWIPKNEWPTSRGSDNGKRPRIDLYPPPPTTARLTPNNPPGVSHVHSPHKTPHRIPTRLAAAPCPLAAIRFVPGGLLPDS